MSSGEQEHAGMVRATGLIGVALGLGVLAGWALDIEVLKRVVPGLVAMKPNTAVSLVLLGAALGLRSGLPLRHGQTIATGCAVGAAGIGLLTLAEYLLGADLGIDRPLFGSEPDVIGTSSPGRMAPTAALSLAALGGALVLIGPAAPRRTRAVEALVLGVAVIATLAMVGYLYGVESLYGVASFTQMAVHTAVAFLVLAAGVLLLQPRHGAMAVVLSDASGGVLARRLLPVVIGAPLLLGWLRLQGERAGLFPVEFGVSLVVIPCMVLLTAVVLWTAAALNRADHERRRQAQRVETANRALEIANQRLAANQQQLDRFFTLSLDMLCIASVDGYFKRLNPAFDTLGYSREELAARPFLDFVHPDDRAATLAEVEKLARGVPTIRFENRYRCKDGSYRWLAWTSAPDEAGTLFAVARDVTEVKQQEAELRRARELAEEANRELEAFSYSVAHDLRAPLRSIDGFSQAVLEDYADQLDDEGRKYLHFVRSSAQQMAQLIDDLLTLSRVTRSELRWMEVDLRALAEAAIETLRRSEPGRLVEWVIGDGIGLARGDPRLLAVVLDNLLGNAWKFTARTDPARIEFGLSDRAGERVYHVRDNGAGFDMAYADKLFGVFQRLHTAAEFEGTGVGLATVQRIVRRHGGRVWAEGAVGRGATFHFTLQESDPT